MKHVLISPRAQGHHFLTLTVTDCRHRVPTERGLGSFGRGRPLGSVGMIHQEMKLLPPVVFGEQGMIGPLPVTSEGKQ